MNEITNQEYVVEDIDEKKSIKKEKFVSTKKTLTGKYYDHLLRKDPIITLLIIGAILGCVFSIYFVSGRWDLWLWIPLSIFFIGPLGLVFIALILPFVPWILYFALRIFIEILANA
ncbi:MAG: hypothetical protein ACFFA4_05550 [Promethearchaeota archaeon]